MSRRVSVGLITLCLVLFAALAACTNQNNTVGPDGSTVTPAPSTATPEVVPTPEPGRVTITGKVVDSNTRRPYQNQIVRLAEIFHIDPGDEGSWMLDDANSPGDLTDDQGVFIFNNVEAKDYVLIVGNIGTRFAVVTDTPDDALVVSTTADQIVNIETVDVVLP